ncbi:hypothetical protein [Chitinophaga sp. MM2321]|uniref:hypothetical protein n=1 Tax=Chitinophaga sp. MM2321 TaxID=3137178 RepID=UPI0032D5A5C4
MKVSNILLAAGVSTLMLMSCGNGANQNADSTGINSESTMPDTAALMPDTVPGAQAPPGAINPGEDSARFGTGAGDSTKDGNRRPQ